MIDDHGRDLPAGPAEESLFGDVTSLIERALHAVAGKHAPCYFLSGKPPLAPVMRGVCRARRT
jgi:hypothetical protein